MGGQDEGIDCSPRIATKPNTRIRWRLLLEKARMFWESVPLNPSPVELGCRSCELLSDSRNAWIDEHDDDDSDREKETKMALLKSREKCSEAILVPQQLNTSMPGPQSNRPHYNRRMGSTQEFCADGQEKLLIPARIDEFDALVTGL